MMDWNGYHWQWGAAAGFFMLLLVLVFIVAIALLVRWLFSASLRSNSPQQASAQRILDERLARGEISVAEYRERSAALAERG